MTQTAQKPISLTLESMLAKFKESFPNLVAPFEAIKPELRAGRGRTSPGQPDRLRGRGPA